MLTTKESLNPLAMAFALNGDPRLTASESRVLVRAVRHTDNASRQVRNSQRAIARSVGVSEDTVGRAFKKAMDFGYFTHKRRRRNAQGHLIADYWFASHPPADPQTCPQTNPQEKEPSNSLYSSTPSKEWIAANAPSFDGLPAPVRVGEPPGGFHVTDHQRVESKLSQERQRQLWEQQNEAEGLDAMGGQGGESVIVPDRYRGRNRA